MKRLALVLIALVTASLAHAQTAAVAPAPGIYTATIPSSGAPCAGCELFTYLAGSNTKVSTYQNAGESATNPSPVILNSSGQAQIWLDDLTIYKFVLAPAGSSDPPSNPYWTTDNILVGGGGGSGGGNVSTTGSPSSGELTQFSSSFTITNTNLSGDCTTTNTLATTCLKTGGVNFGALATLNAVNNTNWSGTDLSVANGGTGASTYTDGQLLIGNSSTTGLSVHTLTAGANVTITNGHGTITIASSGGSSSGCVPTGASTDILYDTGSGACGSSAATVSSTGLINLPASTTSGAFLNLAQGSAPTSPNNGDIWTTSGGVFARIAGTTVGPFGTAGGAVCTTNALAVQYNNAGAFGCAPITYVSAHQVNVGPPDAASPTAQTLGVQNVVAGTSNVSGAKFITRASNGTGTGGSGQWCVDTAPAGSSGSTANTMQDAVCWDSMQHEISGGGTPSCGTNCATVTGTDRWMVVSANGSGTFPTVTANFSKTWSATPVCVFSPGNQTAAIHLQSDYVYPTISTTAITLTAGSNLRNTVWNISCGL